MEKHRWEEPEKRREEERSKKRKSQKKEDPARKGRKVAKHSVFPMICGSGGSKSRLAKAAGAEPCGQMRDEKLHAVVARSTSSQNAQNTSAPDHFWKLRCRKSARRCGAKHISKSKYVYKTHHVRTTFGSCDVEKVHAVVARSTFRSQNARNTPGPDHFWKLRCRKSACRCGSKHISKSKYVYKTHHVRTTFGSCDVEKVHAVVARSTFRSQNARNTPGPDHFWKLRCRKSACRCGSKHISKSKCTKHTTFGPLLEVAMSKKCTPLWREAHFQVKMYKTHHVRTSLGSCDVETVHAVVTRSTFLSQNVQNTSAPDHFWKLRCRKSARRCGAKHISKSKYVYKTHHVRTTFGSCDVEKVHAVVARSTFPSQNVQNTRGFRMTFGRADVVSRGRRKGFCTLSKVSKKREGFVAFSTTTTTTPHFTPMRSTTLYYTFSTFHYTTLYYTTLHYTTLDSITLNYTTLHYPTLHYISLHYTTPITPPQMQLQLNYTN